MSEKRIQSERWLSYLKKVLESAEDDLKNNPHTNDETYKRALSWLETLMSRNPLSPKQAANFIATIQKRVPGKASFSWSGPVALTDRQFREEKKLNTMARFTKVNRAKSTATQIMMETVQAKIDQMDFFDQDVLAAFREHIAAFDPEAVAEEQQEEVDEAIEETPTEPAAPNPVMDSIMAAYPVKSRFPGNMWQAERMDEVHGQFCRNRNRV